MLDYKINFDNIEWDSPIEGVRQKIYRYNDKQVRLVEYSSNMSVHWCKKGHYGIVLDGELEIMFDNVKHVYRKNDVIFIPDGFEFRHQGRSLSNNVLVFFVEDV